MWRTPNTTCGSRALTHTRTQPPYNRKSGGVRNKCTWAQNSTVHKSLPRPTTIGFSLPGDCTGPAQTAHAWLLFSSWPRASAGGSRLACCPKEHSARPSTLTTLFHLILTGLWSALVISQVGRQRLREIQNNFQALLLRACTATCAVGCVS